MELETAIPIMTVIGIVFGFGGLILGGLNRDRICEDELTAAHEAHNKATVLFFRSHLVSIRPIFTEVFGPEHWESLRINAVDGTGKGLRVRVGRGRGYITYACDHADNLLRIWGLNHGPREEYQHPLDEELTEEDLAEIRCFHEDVFAAHGF